MKAYQRKWLGTLVALVGAALIVISFGGRRLDRPPLYLLIDSPSLGEQLVVLVAGFILLSIGAKAVRTARKEMGTE